MSSFNGSKDISKDLLYEGLADATREFTDKVLNSLSSGQQLPSAELFKAWVASIAQDPERWAQINNHYYQGQLELWAKLLQGGTEPSTGQTQESAAPDKRFRAPQWSQLPFFDYLKQSYLLKSHWLMEMVEATLVDEETKHKLRFFTRQLIDAAAPANFPATNPEVLKLASETNGNSLLQGLENLSADLRKGRISTNDENAFEIGRNLAVTPGDVVFQNELMQLIQYRPTTKTVHKRPLLIVPPFINKYYILDLQPENSLVRYAVSRGHTVFLISWRNAPPEMGGITWDQYLEDGPIKAMAVAREICDSKQLNVLGFCVGGTLLSSALAVLSAKNETPASSVTLLATMLDFSDTGDLAVYVDEAYVRQREQEFAHDGVMRGRDLELTFASLRPNDLIWNYVVDSYLKGHKPPAFDLLYWNSDGTNLPGAMYVYYLRNTYLENNLCIPNKLKMCGVPVDLSAVKAPAYILGSREDHIVPWKTAYQSTKLLGGDIEFVLAASGHIAGIINPDAQKRRNYWMNSQIPPAADDWLATAQRKPGSWWSHWSHWLAQHAGRRSAAPKKPGNALYQCIEPAPGAYVRQRYD